VKRFFSLLAASVSLAVMACTAPVAAPAAPVAAPAGPSAARSEPAPPASWIASLDREHPLVGKIWDVRANAFIEASVLLGRVQQARFVLLGERHDNPDHHRLQAGVLESLLRAGRRPAVVLEMLELEQQSAVDRYLASPGATAAGFGAALAWEKTTWPPFAEYQPIFDAAISAKLPIVAGNIAQGTARALVKDGISALPPEQAKALHLEPAVPSALEAPLLDELRASHCGHLPEELLAPMALAQHARDAQLARALLDAAGRTESAGAVLIAGAGHVRSDRAVPYYLRLDAPDTSIVSLAMQEVEHGASDARHYVGDSATASGAAPFDFIWFTPRRSDEDPCAAFKAK